MSPKQGDTVYLCTRDGKKTHNYTYVGTVWGQQDNCYAIQDHFAVPLLVQWNGESWVQCIEKPKET